MSRPSKQARFEPYQAYSGLISTGGATMSRDGSAYYDTNLAVSLSRDTGATDAGAAHGLNAEFTNQRPKQALVGSTQDYLIGLVRGAVTTNNIPLFIPALRREVGAAPIPIEEGPIVAYETDLQPGLTLTWTGPVYGTDDNAGLVQGISPATDAMLLSWPTYGVIPYAVYNTTVNAATPGPAGINVGSKISSGYINLGAAAGSTTIEHEAFVTRLNGLFIAANCPARVATITHTVGSTQVLSFHAVSYIDPVYGGRIYPTVIFDFSLPPPSNAAINSLALNKGGILQTCKMFGFIPNTTFTIRPTPLAGPVTNTPAPRAYQLGFRSTMNLSAYKYARWVPEDQTAALPSPGDFISGYTGIYFDCYSYQHLLNQVLNPTLVRCITDEYDAQKILSEQCLNRQLDNMIRANCNAVLPWDRSTTYGPSTLLSNVSVVHNGYAYISQFASGGPNPPQEPGTGTAWVSCGQSIWNSWSPTVQYYTGDMVTYNTSALAFNVYVANATAPIGVAPTASVTWSLYANLNRTSPAAAMTLRTNNAVIGTTPPTITFNMANSLFTLNADSYGFGGTEPTNADDGYRGANVDPNNIVTPIQQVFNSSYNDYARDSWGLTGVASRFSTPPYSVSRGGNQCYDERMVFEGNDYFHSLFGNWPALRLLYLDPATKLQTSYVRYLPLASNAGLNVPTPLPVFTPTVVSSGYLPYGRVAGNQIYLYTFPQDYPSIGNMWNPVDAIVVLTGVVPIEDDEIMGPQIIGDTANTTTRSQSTSAQTLKILAEFIVRHPIVNGQQYRNEIVYDPQVRAMVEMRSASDLKQFDYQIKLRLKQSQVLRDLSLNNGASVNMRYVFERKQRQPKPA
jgi:hypothetical protein